MSFFQLDRFLARVNNKKIKRIIINASNLTDFNNETLNVLLKIYKKSRLNSKDVDIFGFDAVSVSALFAAGFDKYFNIYGSEETAIKRQSPFIKRRLSLV